MIEFKFDLSSYSPALAELIDPEKINELGPGSPDPVFKARLQAFDFSEAVSPLKVKNETFAQACRAALWLRHDYLDESHTISQGIGHATGSYWHGLMHRREGDYWNSKYWFRRVGEHKIYGSLTDAVHQTFADAGEINLLFPKGGKSWDPFYFIDLVEESIGSHSEKEKLCENVQRLEWLILFDYSFHQAV